MEAILVLSNGNILELKQCFQIISKLFTWKRVINKYVYLDFTYDNVFLSGLFPAEGNTRILDPEDQTWQIISYLHRIQVNNFTCPFGCSVTLRT